MISKKPDQVKAPQIPQGAGLIQEVAIGELLSSQVLTENQVKKG